MKASYPENYSATPTFKQIHIPVIKLTEAVAFFEGMRGTLAGIEFPALFKNFCYRLLIATSRLDLNGSMVAVERTSRHSRVAVVHKLYECK